MNEIKEMIEAGTFIVNVMNNKDIEIRKNLLKQNLGAMLLLTEIEKNDKVQIIQELLSKFKDEKATAPDINYIG